MQQYRSQDKIMSNTMATSEELEFRDKNKELAFRDLKRIRKPFDAEFESLLQEPKPLNHEVIMFGFLELQSSEEKDFVESAVGWYIESEQLTKYAPEIADGLIKSSECVRLWPHSSAIYSENPISVRDAIMIDAEALLSFSLNYIDRWKDYYRILPYEN